MFEQATTKLEEVRDDHEFSQTFVVINGVLPSLLGAVDARLKAFCAFSERYPKLSGSLFLQLSFLELRSRMK